MTGADLIQMLSVLIEVIIAAGAEFIAVKKQKRFGWALCCHVWPLRMLRSLPNGNYPVHCRI
ncbi:MAG: hypothetical protein Q8N94_02400 [Methanoregula sp.]|nr:hypothetical protein [Methanoregula sp.]